MTHDSLPPSYDYTSGQLPPPAAAAAVPAAQPYKGYVSKCLQVTGILQIIAGSLCVVLGIAAAVLQAYLSYLAMPIWGGLFLFILTGILGIVYYCKPRSKCIVVSYLVMAIISGFWACCLFITYAILAALETEYNYWNYHSCHPLNWAPCYGPVWPRKLVDGLLTLVFFMEFVCGTTAASMACYKVCYCCRACCKGCCEEPPHSNVMYYAAGGGAVPMVAIPTSEANRPIYVAGPAGSTASGPPPAPVMIMAQGYPQSGTSPQGQQFVAIQPAVQPAMPTQQGQQVLNLPSQQFVAAQTPVQANVQPNLLAAHSSPSVQPPGKQYQALSAYSMAQQAAPTQGDVQQSGVIAHSSAVAQASPAEKPEKPTEERLDEASGQIYDSQYSDQTALI